MVDFWVVVLWGLMPCLGVFYYFFLGGGGNLGWAIFTFNVVESKYVGYDCVGWLGVI